LIVASIVSFQALLPPLPRLSLDTYPAAARDAIARAHREASDRSTDAKAVGALARVLHAWEQWDAAHEAYARAEALDPSAFDWPYRAGVVLERLARHAEAAARLRQAVAASPAHLPARLKLAEALLEAGAVDEGQALFESLVKDPRAQPAAELGLGRVA